jgi:hypothetical protein
MTISIAIEWQHTLSSFSSIHSIALGFLAYLALGKTHEEAIQAGAYCAYECIQQSGCTYPEKPSFDSTTFIA